MKLFFLGLIFLTTTFSFAERGGRVGAPAGTGLHGHRVHGNGIHNHRPYYFNNYYPHVRNYYYNNFNNLCRQYGAYYRYYRPVYGIWNYFYNPMLFWFYTTPFYYQQVFIPYYQQYYGVNANQASEIPYFPYANAFYPNEDVKEIGIEIGQADLKLQKNFVRAMTFFGTELRKRISKLTKTNFNYSVYSVVITKHKNIEDRFYELEGFVKQGKLYVPYKAIVDIEVPPRTYIVAP